MDTQIKKSKDAKIEKVKELSEKINRAKTIVFANYHGLTVNQLSQLRSKIKEAGGEFIVAKNTLFARALTSYQLPVTSDHLAGPTAVLFAYEDEVAPIKEVAQTARLLGLPKFKFGFFAKEFLDASAIESLSKIPTRDVLNTKFVGAIASPLYGIVSALTANIRNLVYSLDQISNIKNTLWYL